MGSHGISWGVVWTRIGAGPSKLAGMSTPPSFTYCAPTLIWSASDGLERLASYLKRLHVERALLVCDPWSEAHGVAAKVIAASSGRIAHTFALVESDAPRASVQAGAEAARAATADAVVSVGGGSAVDSGKAIALLALHGGDIGRWEGANKIGAPGLPHVAIPTTAGTGSEVSNIAVIKDPDAARKLVLIDRALYPQVAILDPRLTTSLPPALTAATGIDALTHAIEGMVSNFHQPACDAIGLECVRLLRRWLPRAVDDGQNLEARGYCQIAAAMAGQLVSLTFSGIAHAVAHGLGIGFGVHHGTANAIALAWSIRVNARSPSAAAAYGRVAEAWGISRAPEDTETPLALADAIEAEVSRLGLPTRLSSVGVGATELRRLAVLAFADPSHQPNPTPIRSAAELEALLGSLV